MLRILGLLGSFGLWTLRCVSDGPTSRDITEGISRRGFVETDLDVLVRSIPETNMYILRVSSERSRSAGILSDVMATMGTERDAVCLANVYSFLTLYALYTMSAIMVIITAAIVTIIAVFIAGVEGFLIVILNIHVKGLRGGG